MEKTQICAQAWAKLHAKGLAQFAEATNEPALKPKKALAFALAPLYAFPNGFLMNPQRQVFATNLTNTSGNMAGNNLTLLPDNSLNHL